MVRILRSTALALIGVLFSGPPAGASGPVECDDRIQEIVQLLDAPSPQAVRRQWNQHDRFVREAEPGTAYYAPHPFPRGLEEIASDFRYAYFEKLFDKDPSRLKPKERFIYRGLQSGTVKLTAVRVENWSLSRCGSFRRVPFYHLVRLFDEEGHELARASILPTGLMGRYTQISEVGARALPDLQALPTRVEGLLGKPLKVARPHYAAIDGLPLHCGPLIPCAVFETNGSTWILDRSALLFEVRPEAPRRSVVSHREQQKVAGLRTLGPVLEDRTFVTRGFEWVQADLVARDDEMARMQGLLIDPELEN